MINNEFYKDLGEDWYSEEGGAIALLRIEKRAVTPWVISRLQKFHSPGAKVLDIGCGGGLLTFPLATAGFECTALDLSEEIFAAGRARDRSGKIKWVTGDATNLPFENQSFDAVCLIDVLEHIPDARKAVEEALRVLAPSGTLVFHTFNRTFFAALVAAKGLDWFIKGAPKHIHDWRMFIKPEVLSAWLEGKGFKAVEWTGLHPKVFSKAFLKLLFTRRVPADFEFELGGALNVGYLGCARAVHTN